ncbi:hypothetical protein LSH36_1344g00038, partial [Paralvinella palmiformis]
SCRYAFCLSFHEELLLLVLVKEGIPKEINSTNTGMSGIRTHNLEVCSQQLSTCKYKWI